MPPIDRQAVLRFAAVAGGSLGAATVAVAVLQDGFGVPNPSALYLVAVVATAIVSGTWGAVLTSVASFLLYNFLFVDPRYTLTVAQPRELVNLLLLLFVGIVVGQLAALQRSRAEAALAREREALALAQISRTLATRTSTEAVLREIVRILIVETDMRRLWIALGTDDATERTAADSEATTRGPLPQLVNVLKPGPADAPARWVRIHQPSARANRPTDVDAYRVRIVATDTTLGSIWALRDRLERPPTETEDRLLAASADQLGQVLVVDRLAAESAAAEIARQSDALKSALVESVSHDLRTPLA